MQKPDYPITSEAFLDYGVSERVARHLASSELHVFGASVLTGVPEPLGDPSDPHSMLDVELTLLTDGARGWLVLVEAVEEWDAEVELAEFLEEVLEGSEAPPKCVVRGVELDEPPSRGAIDLRDAARIRERLEEEYERHFEGAAPAAVESLLKRFRTYGYDVRDELAIRREMNQDV